MRSTTLLLNSLSAVIDDSIESANVDQTLLKIKVLIFQWMNAFKLQNFLNEATKGKAVP